VACIAAFLALAAVSATATTSYTWTGGASDANWSDGMNWGGSAPSGTVGTLSFPALSGSCTTTCYQTTNNVPNLNVNELSFDILNSYNYNGHAIPGDAITLGGGGLNGAPPRARDRTSRSGFRSRLTRLRLGH
jgi:hypothetical protein